jgi:hypothetical protein
MKVPRCGGTPVVLASNQPSPSGIATDATNVYWANSGLSINDGTIMKVPLNGGTPTTLAVGQASPGGSLAVGGTGVYWSNSSPLGASDVMKVPLSGGVATVLASGQAYPHSLVVNSTGVFWAVQTAIMSAPLNSDTAEPIVSASSVSVFAVHGDSIYWTTWNQGTDGEVLVSPLRSGASTVLATDQAYPAAIVVDDTSTYWANSGSIGQLYADGGLQKVPLGGGPTETIAANQNNVVDLLVDATNVYWTSERDGLVMKAGKQ